MTLPIRIEVKGDGMVNTEVFIVETVDLLIARGFLSVTEESVKQQLELIHIPGSELNDIGRVIKNMVKVFVPPYYPRE